MFSCYIIFTFFEKILWKVGFFDRISSKGLVGFVNIDGFLRGLRILVISDYVTQQETDPAFLVGFQDI